MSSLSQVLRLLWDSSPSCTLKPPSLNDTLAPGGRQVLLSSNQHNMFFFSSHLFGVLYKGAHVGKHLWAVWSLLTVSIFPNLCRHTQAHTFNKVKEQHIFYMWSQLFNLVTHTHTHSTLKVDVQQILSFTVNLIESTAALFLMNNHT